MLATKQGKPRLLSATLVQAWDRDQVTAEAAGAQLCSTRNAVIIYKLNVRDEWPRN